MPPPPVPNIIVVIDHAGAKVFQTQQARAGASASEIVPDPPQQFQHQKKSESHDEDHEENHPADLQFFEQIAVACKAGGRIVLIGRGKGQSNEAHHYRAYLDAHHPDVSARVLPLLTADLSHITDAQLIELGQQTLHAAAIG